MKLFCFLILVNTYYYSFAQQTVFEKSDGLATATYFETINFYKQLATSHKSIKVEEAGQTDAGYQLHVVLLSSDNTFNPAMWRSKQKVIILINNGIHPGEPDGIDASMMLVRDVVNKKITLPNNVVLAIIPIYNIGGALNRNSSTRVNQNGPLSYGFRGNSQNLDLNRDFTKTDTKEASSFAKLFHWLQPDIFIDNHVSDGADYQHTITLITTQYDKLGATAGNWLRNIFEPEIYEGMKQKNWDLIPYVEFDGADFNKGINMFYEPPRYSSGYAALYGTFSFIPETHMLKPYKQRVQATYDLMVTFINKAWSNATSIKLIRSQHLQQQLTQQNFALKWGLDTTKKASIIFKGYQQDTVISQATGLPKMFYNHLKPYTKTVTYFNHFTAQNIVAKPLAYVVQIGWGAVISRLMDNGVQLKQLQKDTSIYVAIYNISEYKSRLQPYEKHHNNYAVKTIKVYDTIRFLKGDYIVPLNQLGNRYLIEMLEPTGDDSFFAWNFFDAILQQKEGYSDYRWDEVAAEILQKDNTLNQQLINKKASDSAFSKNGPAILNYIYKNSKWMEKAYMRYPIYRIE